MMIEIDDFFFIILATHIKEGVGYRFTGKESLCFKELDLRSYSVVTWLWLRNIFQHISDEHFTVFPENCHNLFFFYSQFHIV